MCHTWNCREGKKEKRFGRSAHKHRGGETRRREILRKTQGNERNTGARHKEDELWGTDTPAPLRAGKVSNQRRVQRQENATIKYLSC